MLLDLLSRHPEYFFAGIVSWIIAIGWFMMLFNRMVMADIDPLTGMLGISVVLGMAYMTVNPPFPILQPICIGGMFLSGVMIPILKVAYVRREIKDTDIEGVEKGYEGLVFRPNNASAKIRMARHLYNLGVRGHALAIGESVINELPRKYFPDEYRMIEIWRQHPPSASEFNPIPCVECGHMNEPGLIHCANCGSRFLLDRVKGKIMSSTLGRKLLGTWIVILLALVGIPVAASVGGFGGLMIVVFVLLAAAGAVFMVLRASEEPAT